MYCGGAVMLMATSIKKDEYRTRTIVDFVLFQLDVISPSAFFPLSIILVVTIGGHPLNIF